MKIKFGPLICKDKRSRLIGKYNVEEQHYNKMEEFAKEIGRKPLAEGTKS